MKSAQHMTLFLCCTLATVGVQAQQASVTKARAAITPGLTTATATPLATKSEATSAFAAAVTSTAVTTTGGTANYLSKFTGTATLGNSIIYDNGTDVGIGIIPNGNAKLDLNGAMILRGLMTVSRTGNATPTKGYPSWGFDFYSNVYNSSSKSTVNPFFQLQSEPTGNNTASPGATLNFLYSATGDGLDETGLYFNPNGTIHFASAQTFPGAAGPQGPAGPAGPTGPTGATGPQGAPGTTTLPVNLQALSNLLTVNPNQEYNAEFLDGNGGNCTLGDLLLSTNRYYGGNYQPADGSVYPITSNTALFSLLGTRFGGDGLKTFGVPNLTAATPSGLYYSICVNGVFPPRN